MSDAAIQRLARLHGIAASYHDHRGEQREFSRETQLAILAALGLDLAATGDMERAAADAVAKSETTRWTCLLPPVALAMLGDEVRVPVSIPAGAGAASLAWAIELESGSSYANDVAIDDLPVLERGEIDGRRFVSVGLHLPAGLPLGYHRLGVALDCGLKSELTLIIAPARCFEPRAIAGGRRLWGIAVQLYALRSADSWGIGDFRDLRELIAATAPLGCGIVGLNPLHALMPANPAHISPYSPSNRDFLNVLYIAVPDVAEFGECETARQYVAAPGFQAQLAELRALPNVDYVRVAAAKFAVLKLLYLQFRAAHLAANTPRANEFRQFVAMRGEPLRLHATFDALDAHLRLQGPQYRGWPSWPEEYRDPSSSAVHRFARERSEDVEYFLYLQWLAAQQLAGAQCAALDRGMPIGLYGDVAVGANPAGSETWSNRHLYLQNVSVGAPPDQLALKGQDWGIPPQDPVELRAQAYRPFIDLLRNNMQAVAALRLDHVMALYRLWWVPRGFGATEGAYVRYPLEDLIAILALESVRNRCAVIGEDLGTVPEAVRLAMERYQAYHYRVLLFEKEFDGRFRAPSKYASHALATVTTHDLPTLRGWWESLDVSLRDRLNLYPSEEVKLYVHEGRARDLVHMMTALTETGLWHWQPQEALPGYSPALSRAIHAYLGLSNANIVLIQIEDLIGMTDPVNVPGTDTEHANWQRKVAMDTTDIFARTDVRDILSAVDVARGGQNPNL